MSMKFNPIAVCLILTSPGPGDPTSTSVSCIFSGPPVSLIRMDLDILCTPSVHDNRIALARLSEAHGCNHARTVGAMRGIMTTAAPFRDRPLPWPDDRLRGRRCVKDIREHWAEAQDRRGESSASW